ncbi:hypothetical protein [Novosphingobium sp. 9]|uniref:hypothetical protein n=1 Tax=Novosphingobium sp. 9 TaxID=2025349 RepID=UPI0021B64760|nr:hypothetical protein [Novosphingobium sp. 9]
MSGSALTARTDFDAFARHLTDKAAALAEAAAQTRALERAGDESRWRRADLLWPTAPR